MDSTRNDRTAAGGAGGLERSQPGRLSGNVRSAGAFSRRVIPGCLKSAGEVSYFVPYRKELNFDLDRDDPSNGKSLKIPDGKGTRTAYLAANTRSSLNSAGPLSLPVPFTVVRPAPKGKPGKPYPCGANAAAREGYATPPDLQGRATIDLCWGAGNLTPATGLRYEVARALDSTIIATHLRNWQMGKAPAAAAILPSVQPLIRATLSLVPPAPGQPDPAASRGVMRVSFGQAPQNANAELFRGGRLVDRNGVYFQVTLVKRNGDNFDLLLRSASGKKPEAGEAVLEAPPDYAGALQDAALLVRLMPSQDEEALPQDFQDPAEQSRKGMASPFGMATGAPIETLEFIDEVPGKGESRYFYRVRAVDAAGNTSDWSEVSAPFHTVDTTPPGKPHNLALHVLPGDERILCWDVPQGDIVDGYKLFKLQGQQAEEIGDLDIQRLGRKPLSFNPEIVMLSQVISVGLPDTAVDPMQHLRTNVAVEGRTGLASQSLPHTQIQLLFDVDPGSAPAANIRAIRLDPGLQFDSLVVAVSGRQFVTQTMDPSRFAHPLPPGRAAARRVFWAQSLPPGRSH